MKRAAREPVAQAVRRRRGSLDVGGRRADWVRDGVLAGRPLLLLAHGAGAGYQSAPLELAAAELVQRGVCVARFQFPYMQQAAESGRRRPPDGRPVLLDTWRAMLATARRWRGHGPLFIGGRSMGGRMASMLLAEGEVPGVVGAVYLGYPLHPARRPEMLRAEHLPAVRVPQLFVSGDRDALADLPLLRRALRRIAEPPARLQLVPGGDHGLVPRGPAGPAEQARWLDAVADFMHGQAD